MKKGILSLLAWSLPVLLLAQSFNGVYPDSGRAQRDSHDKGIKWVTGLSWEQIKLKAKAQNKYIFIDAYTTWCGPCKMMDKYVYPNDTVGDFFNEHFIAVKVQMDKTEKDGQPIKDWYNDAAMMEKEFAVQSYPSLIFLSPDADLLQKEQGYTSVQKFVSIAKEALIPSKIYDNPFREYRTLVNEYKHGIKHYDRMPFMIRKAGELNDLDFAKNVFKEYVEYTANLNEKERYTRENIEVWSSFILKLDSKALGLFLKDGDKIDKVMNKKEYSRDIVDKTIQSRIVDSFFRMQKGETITITGERIPNSEVMFMHLPIRADGKIQPDYVEADWKTLKTMIGEHFSKDYILRNLMMAKMRWYKQHQNMTSLLKIYFNQLLAKYPPVDLDRNYGPCSPLNQNSWETFLFINDKKLLKKALTWMDRLIQHHPRPVSNYMDTYANIYYKLGRTKEAISWEEKAIELLKMDDKANHLPDFQLTLEQMKKGEPTYLEQGAIWPKK